MICIKSFVIQKVTKSKFDVFIGLLNFAGKLLSIFTGNKNLPANKREKARNFFFLFVFIRGL